MQLHAVRIIDEKKICLNWISLKKHSQYENLHTVLKLSFNQKKVFFFQKSHFFNIRIVNMQLLHIVWREKYLEVNGAVAVTPGIKSRLKTFIFKNN